MVSIVNAPVYACGVCAKQHATEAKAALCEEGCLFERKIRTNINNMNAKLSLVGTTSRTFEQLIEQINQALKDCWEFDFNLKAHGKASTDFWENFNNVKESYITGNVSWCDSFLFQNHLKNTFSNKFSKHLIGQYSCYDVVQSALGRAGITCRCGSANRMNVSIPVAKVPGIVDEINQFADKAAMHNIQAQQHLDAFEQVINTDSIIQSSSQEIAGIEDQIKDLNRLLSQKKHIKQSRVDQLISDYNTINKAPEFDIANGPVSYGNKTGWSSRVEHIVKLGHDGFFHTVEVSKGCVELMQRTYDCE